MPIGTIVDGIKSIKDFLKENQDISDVNKLRESIKEFNTMSLSQRVNKYSVTSSVIMDNTVATNEIVRELHTFLSQTYLAYVIVALQMEQHVSETQSVKDLLGTISTEDVEFVEELLGLTEDCEKYFATESNIEVSAEAKETYLIELENKVQNMFSAKLVEVGFACGKDGRTSVNLPVLLQLFPKVLPGNVMQDYIGVNFTEPMRRRYLKWKNGEIRFWKDFIFEMDILTKNKEAIKNDNSGVLRSAKKKSNSAFMKRLKNVFDSSKNKKANLASNLVIVSQENFMKSCADNKIDFNKKKDREKFFESTLTFILVVVDDSYQVVNVWYNGIDSHAEYSFDELTRGNRQSGGKFELKDIMAALSAGQSQFRR